MSALHSNPPAALIGSVVLLGWLSGFLLALAITMVFGRWIGLPFGFVLPLVGVVGGMKLLGRPL